MQFGPGADLLRFHHCPAWPNYEVLLVLGVDGDVYSHMPCFAPQQCITKILSQDINVVRRASYLHIIRKDFDTMDVGISLPKIKNSNGSNSESCEIPFVIGTRGEKSTVARTLIYWWLSKATTQFIVTLNPSFPFDIPQTLRIARLCWGKPRVHTIIRQRLFAVGMMNPWNSLLSDIVTATSINVFKSGLIEPRNLC